MPGPKAKKAKRVAKRKVAQTTGKRAKNLFLDAGALRGAEEYSRQHGTTISQLVENYFFMLTRGAEKNEEELSPVVKALYGIAAGRGLSEADYKEHLWRKYVGEGK